MPIGADAAGGHERRREGRGGDVAGVHAELDREVQAVAGGREPCLWRKDGDSRILCSALLVDVVVLASVFRLDKLLKLDVWN